MKVQMSLLVAALAMVVFAADVQKAPTPEEIAARKEAGRKMMLEKTGGFVELPASGKIAIVNCQSKIPVSVITKGVEMLRKVLRVNVVLQEGQPVSAADLFVRTSKNEAAADSTMYLVNDAALPMSLHAPEACWIAVNVDKLDDVRFGKEFARASTFLLGCSVSKFTTSVMQTVTSPEGLDKIVSSGIAMDMMPSIHSHLQAIGVHPAKKATYRRACMDGWASKPTNDYQKVIWEEVHAKPTNPMKIQFDPKKGE